MKIAILGGSFNPVHTGHLFLADSVVTKLGYDRLILIPAFESPFKTGAEGAPSKDRLDMLAASISGDPRLTIDDCEINRKGISYTIDTVKDIIDRFKPDGKPGLVLGDDLASTFYKWKSPREIAELTDIIIARRLNFLPAGDTPEKAAGQSVKSAGQMPAYACEAGREAGGSGNWDGFFPYAHKTLDNEIINISSRMVREKISRAEAWRYMVPCGARLIIEDRMLYGYVPRGRNVNDYIGKNNPKMPGKDLGGLAEIIFRLENEVRTVLSFGRFIHSRNTALLSRDLCLRFGLDPEKGYLAGIAHDICKSMGEGELIRLSRMDGGAFSRLEQKKPSLLHARAAAVYIHKKYNIFDEDILEAVRYHTIGNMDMSVLAKLVYIADKIEVSRTGIDPALREMSQAADLDILFEAVLHNTVAYLKSQDKDISYSTRRMLAAMQKRTRL